MVGLSSLESFKNYQDGLYTSVLGNKTSGKFSNRWEDLKRALTSSEFVPNALHEAHKDVFEKALKANDNKTYQAFLKSADGVTDPNVKGRFLKGAKHFEDVPAINELLKDPALLKAAEERVANKSGFPDPLGAEYVDLAADLLRGNRMGKYINMEWDPNNPVSWANTVYKSSEPTYIHYLLKKKHSYDKPEKG